MNSKNILKAIACAGALAVAGNSLGDSADWFDGSVAATNNATFNAPAGVTIESGKFVLENDASSALVLTPSAALGTDSDGVVVINATAVLTPCSADSLPDVSDAKAGFAVGDDNGTLKYYAYNGSTWTNLTGATPPAAVNDVYEPTIFTITMNYRDGTASFKVGNTPLTPSVSLPANTTALASVDAFGSGSLASIDANYEIAAYEYDGKKYASIDDVPVDGQSSATISGGGMAKLIETSRVAYGTSSIALATWMNANGVKPDGTGDGVASSVATALNATAANGLKNITSYALGLNAAETLKAVPSSTKVANRILLTPNVTPAAGFTVTYLVDGSAATMADGDISLPLETGSYAITATVE